MATIKQGILGGFSGRVAGVVGSSWKGIAVMKSRPQSVANPQTAGQVAQRTKFSNTTAFAVAILATVIKPLWDRFASGISGYNDFVRTNIALFTAALPVEPSQLIISKGKMALTAIASAISSAAGVTLTVTWVDDSGEGFKLATDIPYVVFVNEETSTVEGFAIDGTRADEAAIINVANALEEGGLGQCYLAFKRADGTIVSNTAYSIIEANA